jgi:CheY-like chemotaxis protein
MPEVLHPRVLVVDDEPHVRELLRDLLHSWGYGTETAANGAEALRRFERGGFHLVLTDFLMPGPNGLAVAEGVRASDPRVGVIMLTGSPDDLEGESARLGFRLMRKPLHPEALRAAVRQALEALTGAPAGEGGPTAPPSRTPLRP